jgi:leucyl-tRNA synthetase
MSKSKGNVINPDEVVTKFGADAVRMYLAFIGPYNEPGHYPWNLDGSFAMRKFLDRIYALLEKRNESTPDEATLRALAQASAKVGAEIDRFKFNTAISTLMILVRDLEALQEVPTSTLMTLTMLLAPFAPHLAEHMWSECGGTGSVHTQPWPEVDPSLLLEDTDTVIVQINGKKRAEMTLPKGASEEEALLAARSIAGVESAINGGAPKRVIYVPGRILNIVI